MRTIDNRNQVHHQALTQRGTRLRRCRFVRLAFGQVAAFSGLLACCVSCDMIGSGEPSAQSPDPVIPAADPESRAGDAARMRPTAIPIDAPFASADDPLAAGPGTLVYQNTNHQFEFFGPGAGFLMGDDLTLAGTNRKLSRIRHVCVFSPGPASYSVTMQLWTDDPNDCGPLTPILGTSCMASGLAPGMIHDAAGTAPCDFSPATSPILPNKVWLMLGFSTDQSGWLLAYQAETGSTADEFFLSSLGLCTDYTNDYAGQCGEIYADPTPTGACCVEGSGVCTNGVTEASCEGGGNRYGGDGSTCATIQPPCSPPATGACCTSNGPCIVTTGTACNGAYLGDNTACASTGACCADRDNDGANEHCVVTAPACCALAGGGFSGPGTSCATTGSCCYDGDGNGSPESCLPMSSTCCGGLGGAFGGAGSACGSLHGDVAPQPNGNGIVNLDDILCVLQGFSNFATCPGADLLPCGGNGVTNLDDILSELKAFSGVYDCAAACFDSDCNNNGVPDDEEVQGGGVFAFTRSPGFSIPDNNLVGVSDAIVVGNAATIVDIEVEFHVSHTSNRDLTITLTHDDDAQVALVQAAGRVTCGMAGTGYQDDGFDVTIDDEASSDIHFYQDVVGAPGGPLTGTWRPDVYCGEVALTIFEGSNMSGVWTLRVVDSASGNTGTLVSWGLRIRTTPPTAPDCNGNGVPDACDVALSDCNNNGVPDTCDGDCNNNGLADECDIAMGAPDLNGNQRPDSCDPDCNGNAVPDDHDIAVFGHPDCNGNGTPDLCDLAAHISRDRQPDGIPDECQLLGNDCQPDLIPDDWQVDAEISPDCNNNQQPDECDVLHGASSDFNNDGIPDECGFMSSPFQLFGFNPSSAGEGHIVEVFGTGFPSFNPLDYCVNVGNMRAGAEVIQVNPNSLLLRIDGNTERAIGPIAVASGIGGFLEPDIDPLILTENGRFFTGFSAAQVGLFNVAPADILAFNGTFNPNLNGGSFCLELKGDWKKNDKYYVHMHMRPTGSDQPWDYTEDITFTADDTGAQCADKIKKRFNDAATAAGCNCTATVNGSTIKVTCTGGATNGWGSATLKEWKRECIASAIGKLTVERTATGFTFTDNGMSTSVPTTTVTIGEKTLEYGCKYETNLDGRAGLLKILATTGSPTNDVKYIQLVKGTFKRDRGGVESVLATRGCPGFVLDGKNPAGPNWPLGHGRGFVDFPSAAVPIPPTLKEGDKLKIDISFQTYVICNNKVLGFLKWENKGTLCIGATAAGNAWQAPAPSPSKTWVPRDMTAGSEFKMAFDHLKTIDPAVN